MTTAARTALTQEEFTGDDFDQAERIARRLGYQQYAYTSTSALVGLFCLAENDGITNEGGCIIKTVELGFLFVQDSEDRGLGFNWEDVAA